MAPRWPKRAPRGAQEGSKTAPRSPKIAPRAPQRGPQDAIFEPPRGGTRISPPLFLSHGAHDCPKRPPRLPQRAPRGPQDPPIGANRLPKWLRNCSERPLPKGSRIESSAEALWLTRRCRRRVHRRLLLLPHPSTGSSSSSSTPPPPPTPVFLSSSSASAPAPRRTQDNSKRAPQKTPMKPPWHGNIC